MYKKALLNPILKLNKALKNQDVVIQTKKGIILEL